MSGEGELDAIATRVLDDARRAAPTADVSVKTGSERAANVRFGANEVESSGDVDDDHVTIEVAFGKRHASASTNQTDEKATRDLVARVIAMAKVAPEDPEHMPLLPRQTYVAMPDAWDSRHRRDVERVTRLHGRDGDWRRAARGSHGGRLPRAVGGGSRAREQRRAARDAPRDVRLVLDDGEDEGRDRLGLGAQGVREGARARRWRGRARGSGQGRALREGAPARPREVHRRARACGGGRPPRVRAPPPGRAGRRRGALGAHEARRREPARRGRARARSSTLSGGTPPTSTSRSRRSTRTGCRAGPCPWIDRRRAERRPSLRPLLGGEAGEAATAFGNLHLSGGEAASVDAARCRCEARAPRHALLLHPGTRPPRGLRDWPHARRALPDRGRKGHDPRQQLPLQSLHPGTAQGLRRDDQGDVARHGRHARTGMRTSDFNMASVSEAV